MSAANLVAVPDRAMEERNQLPSSVTAWLQGWQWARHEARVSFFLLLFEGLN